MGLHDDDRPAHRHARSGAAREEDQWGDKVVVWFVSGNFDEEVFPEPERFDLGRDPNPHMTFGSGGPHVCIGAHLARLEIRVMFEELLPRLRDLEVTGPISRLRSNFINGVKHMPVRVDLAGHET